MSGGSPSGKLKFAFENRITLSRVAMETQVLVTIKSNFL